MAFLKIAQRNRMVKVAAAAAEARIAGATRYKTNLHEFRLAEGGMCARLARQCCEEGQGLADGDGEFGADSARNLCEVAKGLGRVVDFNDANAGDIGFWLDGYAGVYGHVAIWLGDWYGDGRKLWAENTSVAARGNPQKAGTKLTRKRPDGCTDPDELKATIRPPTVVVRLT